jgi:hypothetical protein
MEIREVNLESAINTCVSEDDDGLHDSESFGFTAGEPRPILKLQSIHRFQPSWSFAPP